MGASKIFLSKKVLFSLILQVMNISLTMSLLLFDYNYSDTSIRVFSILGTLNFIFFLILWKYVNGSLFSPFILFLSSFFFFQFGQCFLFIFNLDIYLKVFIEHSNEIILKGAFMTVLSMQFFYLGGTLSLIKTKKILGNIGNENYENTIKSMRIVGWILLCLSAPIKIFYTIVRTIASLKYGYMNLYNYEGSMYIIAEPKIYSLFSPLFLTSFILLIVSYKDNKAKVKLLIAFFLIFTLIDLLAGGRSLFIASVLTIICIFNLLIKKINYKNALTLVLVFVLLISIIPFMAYWRLQDEKNANSIIEALEYVKSENPFVSTINELGGSMSPLLYTMKIVPDSVEFKMGESYLASVATIIPNIFNFMGDVHPASDKAHLAQWLMEYSNMDHGPGFSMVAESYYNFRYFGVFIILIWGYIFGSLLRVPDSIMYKSNPIQLFILFSSLLLFFTFPRGQSIDFVRNLIYYILGCIVLVKLFERKRT